MSRVFKPRNLLMIGGIFASAVLVVFGIACIVAGFLGRDEVQDQLAREKIVAPQDSAIPGQLVDTGSEAKAMADVMRKHALESSGGLTYAQMGRYKTPDGNPAGTDDANAAVKDQNGKPVSNSARDLWVTETALTTALNTAYFADLVGLWAIIMGIALLLSGIGFAVLTLATFWHHGLVARSGTSAPLESGASETITG